MNKNKVRKLIDKIRESCQDEPSAKPMKVCPSGHCENLCHMEYCVECYADQLAELTGQEELADKFAGLTQHAAYVAADLIGSVE